MKKEWGKNFKTFNLGAKKKKIMVLFTHIEK